MWIFKQHVHTHTRLTALCPGLPRWAGTRKVKPTWILLEQEIVSGSGISWAICRSAPRSRQTTMPAPHHSVFYTSGSIIRPRRIQAVQRCSLLLPLVFNGLYVCLSVGHNMSCAKTAEPFQMPFGMLTQVGPWKCVLCGGWISRGTGIFGVPPFDAAFCQNSLITHTHTQHLTDLFLGLPVWAGTRKVKPICILLKQDTNKWQWHQLGHKQVCRQITTPAPDHSVFYRLYDHLFLYMNIESIMCGHCNARPMVIFLAKKTL